MPDVVVVGAGPNGLAAALRLQEQGCSVQVREAAPTPGGGARTAELTLPGFRHDVCSAIHPLAAASPYLSKLPLHEHGLHWIEPPVAVAHPLRADHAAWLTRSLDESASRLGPDADRWRHLFGPALAAWKGLQHDVLGPLLRIPRHPLAMASFGLRAIQPASWHAHRFKSPEAKALWAGLAAHSMLPLNAWATSGFSLTLGLLAHHIGWPLPRGGAQSITDAMVSLFRSRGGELVTGAPVGRLDDLPPARAVLFDITPRQLLAIAGDTLPARYRSQLQRYRYGVAAFKLDWALEAPIPWQAQPCRQAGTVHVGGPWEVVQASVAAAWQGHPSRLPFILVAQPSRFDATRAPAGQHVGWAYCHVPNGWTGDMTDAIEDQMERFAPGFRQTILARSVMRPAQFETYNANYVGGDINGGVQDIRQLITRPVLRLDPYSTPDPRLFLCSSATPPGGGVHGLCGWFAAHSAWQRRLR
ncbi:MAG: phytoene desaturase family protein [Candidatus Xenobia bacterium]